MTNKEYVFLQGDKVYFFKAWGGSDPWEYEWEPERPSNNIAAATDSATPAMVNGSGGKVSSMLISIL